MIRLLLFLVLLSQTALADDSEFDHSRFYQAKTDVKSALADVGERLKSRPSESEFKSEVEMRLALVAAKYPIDFAIFTSTINDADVATMVMVGYTDAKGFIGWKFDTIFSQGAVYFFSFPLSDRVVPELKPDDYYRWKVIVAEKRK